MSCIHHIFIHIHNTTITTAKNVFDSKVCSQVAAQHTATEEWSNWTRVDVIGLRRGQAKAAHMWRTWNPFTRAERQRKISEKEMRARKLITMNKLSIVIVIRTKFIFPGLPLSVCLIIFHVNKSRNHFLALPEKSSTLYSISRALTWILHVFRSFHSLIHD